MTIRNLTPHELVVFDHDGTVLLALPSCPAPPRIDQQVVDDVVVAGVVIHDIRYGRVVNLPDAAPGTLLVVLRVVAREVPRHDLVAVEIDMWSAVQCQ